MAIYYFKSEDVKVFPCSYRGIKYSEEEVKVNVAEIIDPEARLNSERNFTNISGTGSNNCIATDCHSANSYIINYDGQNISCVIGGYTFRIVDSENKLDALSDAYLCIKTQNLDIVAGVEDAVTPMLCKYESTANERYLDAEDGEFKGVAICESAQGNAFVKIKENGITCLKSFLPDVIQHGANDKSVAIGTGLLAETDTEVVLGQYNKLSGENPLFVIGDGTATNRHNAVLINQYKSINVNAQKNLNLNAEDTIAEKAKKNIKLDAPTNTINGDLKLTGGNNYTSGQMLYRDNNGFIHTTAAGGGASASSSGGDGSFTIGLINNVGQNANGQVTAGTGSVKIETGDNTGEIKVGGTNIKVKGISASGTSLTDLSIGGVNIFNNQGASFEKGLSIHTGRSIDICGKSSDGHEIIADALYFWAGKDNETVYIDKSYMAPLTDIRISYYGPNKDTSTQKIVKPTKIRLGKGDTLSVTNDWQDVLGGGGSQNEPDPVLDIYAGKNATDINTLKMYGTVQATNFVATSDKRLKENITPYNSEKSILDLPVYKYDFINGPKNQIGCLAQDLQEICPEIVMEQADGTLCIQESKLVYLLLDEVKKLRKEINELKDKE